MPLKRCGSVSARLSVWLRGAEPLENAAGSASRTSSPPGSCCAEPASPRDDVKRCPALVPASVRMSVPSGKSNAARPILPAGFAPAWLPVQSPGDHEMQDEAELVFELEDDPLAESAQAGDRLAVQASSGGSMERRRKGLRRRTRWRV